MHSLGLLSPRGERRGGPKDSPPVERVMEIPKLQRESRNSVLEGSEGVLVLSQLAGHPERCAAAARLWLRGSWKGIQGWSIPEGEGLKFLSMWRQRHLHPLG